MSQPSSPGKLAQGALRGLFGATVVLACTAVPADAIRGSAGITPSVGKPTSPRPASAPLRAQASSPPPLVFAPVHIHGVTYDRARHSLVLTITGPVTISTRVLKSPPRLVVDIPSASLDSANRELVIKDDLVTRVRVSQFKIIPPTVRLVIETATENEPLIAVQQTGKRLYVTLAPARPGEVEPTPEGVLPSPGPEPSSFTPPTLIEATPAPIPSLRPTPAWRPAATPTPAWRPPVATPTPLPTPTGRPGIQMRLRPGMTIPTPAVRRTPPPSPAVSPGGEWRDLFPSPAGTRRPTPAPAATRTPIPFWTPPAAPASPAATPFDAEPTPIPPPRGTEETGNETWPSVP